MAHIRRKLSIADLVEDLKLLGVSANGYRTADELQGARDERIENLKKANGTLDEVCFTSFFLKSESETLLKLLDATQIQL